MFYDSDKIASCNVLCISVYNTDYILGCFTRRWSKHQLFIMYGKK